MKNSEKKLETHTCELFIFMQNFGMKRYFMCFVKKEKISGQNRSENTNFVLFAQSTENVFSFRKLTRM